MKILINNIISISLFIIGLFYFNNCIDFELKLFEVNLSTYFLSGIVARIIVSGFFVIAIFLFLNKTVKALNIIAIILFSIPLYISIYDNLYDEIIKIGFSFSGSTILLPSLYVLAIICLLFLLIKPIKNTFTHKAVITLRYLASALMVTLVFVFNPVFPEEFTDISVKKQDILLSDLSKLGDNEQKTLAVFFSTSCPYCELASKRLTLLQSKKNGFPEIMVYFLGTEEGVSYFFEETNTKLDYKLLDQETFIQFTGGSFPKFMLIEKNEPQLYLDGRSFNYTSPSVIRDY